MRSVNTTGANGWRALLVLLVLAGGVAPAAAGEVEEAAATVRALHEGLLDSMKAGPELDFGQRRERLRPLVERTHHFAVIARFALGRHARRLDDAQFARVVTLFGQLVVAEYARHFDGYQGESLNFLDAGMRGHRVLVETELIKADGESIPLDYLLEVHDGRWGVVNVIADGVSDLALRRAEYSALLADEGYQALIDHLRVQIAEIRPQ